VSKCIEKKKLFRVKTNEGYLTSKASSSGSGHARAVH